MKHGERRTNILDYLNQINASVYESNQLDDAFQIILSNACKFFKATTGLIGAINEDRAQLEIEAQTGLRAPAEPIPLNSGIIGRTAFNRKALLIKNFKLDSYYIFFYF